MSFEKNTYRGNEPLRPNHSTSTASQTSPTRFAFLAALQDRRLRLLLGLGLIAFSLFLLLSFVSFFWTGKADQSIAENFFSTLPTEAGREAENWVGLTGALLAHLFIYSLFGVGSLLILPSLLFYAGWIFAFGYQWRKFRIISIPSLFLLIWGSILLGYGVYLFDSQPQWAFFCGSFGYHVAALLSDMIGVGTPLLLIFSAALFGFFYKEEWNSLWQDSQQNFQTLRNLGSRKTEQARKNPAFDQDDLPFETQKTRATAEKNNTDLQEQDSTQNPKKERSPANPDKKAALFTQNPLLGQNEKPQKAQDDNKNPIKSLDNQQGNPKNKTESKSENKTENKSNPKKDTTTRPISTPENTQKTVDNVEKAGQKKPEKPLEEDFVGKKIGFQSKETTPKDLPKTEKGKGWLSGIFNPKKDEEREKEPTFEQQLEAQIKEAQEEPTQNPTANIVREANEKVNAQSAPAEFTLKNRPKEDFPTQDDEAESATDEEAAASLLVQQKPQIEEKNTKKQPEVPVFYRDPRGILKDYQLPPTTILETHGAKQVPIDREDLENVKNRIVQTLENFKIRIKKITAEVGPTVTLYEIVPAEGVKISQIRNLGDDIALNLSALGIRIIAPMPGKGTIGIEVPNKNREIVPFRALVETPAFQHTKKELPLLLGKTISNEVFVADLTKMPHLLIGGATGQGKSVGINVILASLLYKRHPDEIKFVMIDPKKVEFSLFSKLEKHYLAHLPNTDPIVTDPAMAVKTLEALCKEMDLRYDLLRDADCRNVREYNAKFLAGLLEEDQHHRFLPYIVLVIDELADLMIIAGKAAEKPIARLAQMARAIGIHLVVATQRPSVNVVTGIIKANFPARMAFRVTSKIDSRIILDASGAEQLIGQGDMLLSNGSDILRLQCAFLDTPEVESVCKYIAEQQGFPAAYPLPEDEPEEEEMEEGENDVF
ncbi:DNA translocase FtsK [Hugenholtzia roseola]|uniref:DNA translocase FtsK n=1 Tax=Hugenholtzia roseola TaxID=1002 RepID=UPI001FE04B5D|nr:DNA translocase FtsK 4TM domain-containing protein [Hugenholtzia roseola]